MDTRKLFCAGFKPAARYAGRRLESLGVPITYQPSSEVGSVLLDVPSFNAEGLLHSGESIDSLLAKLPKDICIYGGNLNHPSLQQYRTVDLLQDPDYLAQNAYITAECALDVALPYLPITLRGCPCLIIGWGRIGKCLGQILKTIGADVTIAARKNTDRAMIRALGCESVDTLYIEEYIDRYRLIFNTVPVPLLSTTQTQKCHPDCVKIELASKNGIEGDDVILARGLPGIHMPESSGNLIAETLLNYDL